MGEVIAVFNILIAEDDSVLREHFAAVLSERGYNTITAANGSKALEKLEHQYIDLIITDITMPQTDGFEFITQLREANYQLPILIITARGGIEDKRKGFAVGADDYMVKPANVNEMIWRVEALLKRCQAVKRQSLQIGETLFNCNNLTVTFGGNVIELPKKEFYLIFKLVSATDKIFTKRQLFDEIWGFDSKTDIHTLEVHINRLRKKLKNNKDIRIVTVKGLGYKATLKN